VLLDTFETKARSYLLTPNRGTSQANSKVKPREFLDKAEGIIRDRNGNRATGSKRANGNRNGSKRANGNRNGNRRTRSKRSKR
jgi:hypothetical protein